MKSSEALKLLESGITIKKRFKLDYCYYYKMLEINGFKKIFSWTSSTPDIIEMQSSLLVHMDEEFERGE